ncbi:SDR family NAD(P)-dependent oxidoreductase [Sphingomonas jatrophae]|uniref:NAD(P)-dependent dehydrogenase, short-chain alcohol dehydrogenase family n=1 Tax=Sphingomonas jatrophae TaxID=1166337 RepID=A0A1I6KC14_9SPHN|nr:SDR family oxidoreductase [Sphingomonas jatrophae]SFR88736.1 NAD(P)-dependent dehydrogenase, short-chain alcohol dehydrogenase family [Sphingomonas jatrophae]
MEDVASRLASPSTGVVITGGASGLGFASARALAAVGRAVALWDLDAGRAEAAAKRIADEHGVAASGHGIDVRDLAAIERGAAATCERIGQVGGLVHCAGVVDTDGLDGMTEQSWNDGIAVHLRALPFLIKAFLADLQAAPGAAIVATASINATLGHAVNPIYSAGKGGVLAIVRSLADRLGRDGIRINSISPGQIVTPMMQPTLDAIGATSFEQRILLSRLGQPEEIGRVVRFLLSDEASYITAAEIVVDGGNISSQR